MKLCRFQTSEGIVHIGLITDEPVLVDPALGKLKSLNNLSNHRNLAGELANLAKQNLPRYSLAEARLLTLSSARKSGQLA